jgi:bla regulator protein blaR1
MRYSEPVMNKTVHIMAAAAVLAAAGLAAQSPQSPPAESPAFEVASIKPNSSGDGRVMMQTQPGRFMATNITLRLLIRNAYQLQDFQITGGPGWIASERFDINAKMPDGFQLPPGPPLPGAGPGPMQLMLRGLLAERFKLAVHNETKEAPIYALILARRDGNLGPGLKKSDVDCAAVFAAGRARGAMPPPPQLPQPGESIPCGIRFGPGNLAMGGSPLSQFANSIGMFAGRIVLDRTGLAGNYDIMLTWTPDQMPQRPAGAGDQPPMINGVAVDPNAPSLFTAVQEQLGLKLDSQRGPVDLLVIDRAEKPVEE